MHTWNAIKCCKIKRETVENMNVWMWYDVTGKSATREAWDKLVSRARGKHTETYCGNIRIRLMRGKMQWQLITNHTGKGVWIDMKRTWTWTTWATNVDYTWITCRLIDWCFTSPIAWSQDSEGSGGSSASGSSASGSPGSTFTVQGQQAYQSISI